MRFRRLSLAVALCLAGGATAHGAGLNTSAMVDRGNAVDSDAHGIVAFATAAAEPLVGVLVEIDGERGFVAQRGALVGDALRAAAGAQRERAWLQQDAFLARMRAQGLPLLLREKDLYDGPRRSHLQYRFSYLLNGFIAFVPQSRVAELARMPGVRSVSRAWPAQLRLDKSVNYILGHDFSPADRRLAVYGATEELGPSGSNGNGPQLVAVDGLEGQGMVLGVIDSGMDFNHPMLGGSGSVGTPAPQKPPADTGPGANKKVLYWYNLGGASTNDDNGHGTHVSTTAGGYAVDGNTPAYPPTQFGPTPGGVRLHGVAPEAQMMNWPVCNAAGNCVGDTELALEDAVSPVVLTGQGDGNSVPVPGSTKPIADVVNLSLGGGNDPAASSSRASNNSALAGLVVVAAAGNDGPGASTVGAPCVATMAICVASVLDPGSTASSDVLAASEITGELCAGTNNSCALPAPAAETGAASEANALEPGERAGLRTYLMAGGGDLPGGSVSAHYVYADRDQATVPTNVTGRIALLNGGTGTFFQIVNPVAALSPKAIILITDTTSATAIAVVNGVPVYTLPEADGAYLLSKMLASGTPTNGAVSRLPLRVSSALALDTFTGDVSEFSSRGPNAADNARYRTIKPEVAAPGSGVLAGTTPTGVPEQSTKSAADASGYTVLSGTSMATPHVSGAATLVRQHVRALGLDSTTLADADYTKKRFRAATLTRALLANTASDLRTGRGGGDPAGVNPAYTINDIGAGLVDVEAAIAAKAVMTSLTPLFDENPNEYTPPANVDQLPGVARDAANNLLVPLPTYSFGNVEVIGAVGAVSREQKVTIDNFHGDGGGIYDLAWQNDVLADHPSVQIQFLDVVAKTPITRVTVGTAAGSKADFLVRIGVNGSGGLAEGALLSWYVTATPAAGGQRLRMPFLYHAVRLPLPTLGQPGAPNIGQSEQQPAGKCVVDTDNHWQLLWTYAHVNGALDPSGYRLQRGTYEQQLFNDDASETLVAGENTYWAAGGTAPQWASSTDPNTASAAYFVADTANQDEPLLLKTPVNLPSTARGATLELTTSIDTEAGYDYANVEVNGDGGAFTQVGRYSGVFKGVLNFDVSSYVGKALGVQWRMTSDLSGSATGWYVDNVRVLANDYANLADVGPTPLSYDQAQVAYRAGIYRYRVAGLYDTGGGAIGPYTASTCVCVTTAAVRAHPPADSVFGDGFDADETCAQ